MWVLIALPLLAAMPDAPVPGFDTRQECVDAVGQIRVEMPKRHPELVPLLQKFYCIPADDWRAGENGMNDENEVK